MLKFFFHRDSQILKACFFASICLSFYFFNVASLRSFSVEQLFFIVLFFLQVLINLFFAYFPFYKQKGNALGICLQYKKALVPLIYIWFTALSGYFLLKSCLFFVIFNFLLLPVTVVAFILFVFYLKDPQRQKVNLLTRHG